MEVFTVALAIACLFMGMFLLAACKDLCYLSDRLYDMEYKNLRIAVRVQDLTRDLEQLRQETKDHIHNPNLAWNDDVDGIDIAVTEEIAVKEVEVVLHWMNEGVQEQKTLTINVPKSVVCGYPSLIRHEGHYYIFSPFNFGFEPIYYFRVKSFLDLDEVKDESLEEVLSKE